MTSIEKNIVKLFLNINVPHEFENSVDKILLDEFLKGKCTVFIKSSKIDNDSYVKIVTLKNELSKDINFQKDENVNQECIKIINYSGIIKDNYFYMKMKILINLNINMIQMVYDIKR